MYEHFFGFNEPPFNLTPDPRFLFLSRQHKEALASLSYGIRERKGFVVLTGEVGSGKTTICRALFQELDPKATRLALVLNPMLTEVELLQAINEEFALPSTSTSKKELLQVLNEFLLAENAQGHNVILIIDEAQNLPFPTLELIRMISNLETETEKLIQIVLVGQPELQDILRRRELEQLRQRISVRYHMAPLNREEMETYIRRRIEVAGAKMEITLTEDACDRLYQLTRGVPRKINVLCDRTLLAAYVESTYTITARLISKAAAELGETEPEETPVETAAESGAELTADGAAAPARAPLFTPAAIRTGLGIAALVIIVFAFSVGLSVYIVNLQQQAILDRTQPLSAQAQPGAGSGVPAAGTGDGGGVLPLASAKSVIENPDSRINPNEPAGPLSERPTPTPEPTPVPAEVAEDGAPGDPANPRPRRTPLAVYRFNWEYDQNGVLRVADPQFAESSAFFNILALWNITFPAEEFRKYTPEKLKSFPFERSKMNIGRVVWPVEWGRAIKLNMPFIAGWSDPQSRLSTHVVVRRIEGRMVTVLDGVHGLQSLERAQIEANLHSAIFYYFDAEQIAGLGAGATGPAVTALQEKLRILKAWQGDPTGTFDAATERAVTKVQRDHGLEETGGVYPLTACVIQTLSRPDRPVLWEEGGYAAP